MPQPAHSRPQSPVHSLDAEMHELNHEADYLEEKTHIVAHGPNGTDVKLQRHNSDPDAQAMVIASLKAQVQDLFSQVSQLNGKLVKSYDRMSDLEDELHVTTTNLRGTTLKVGELELERAQHLAALSSGLLVEKDHVTAELNRLMEKATEEAAQRGQAESARAQIETELDDLSAGLFNQANSMVAEARIAQAKSERKVEETERALREAEEVVGLLQTQMQALQAEKERADRRVEEMRVTVGKGKWVERVQDSHPTIPRLMSLHAPYQEYLAFITHLRSIRPATLHPPAMSTLLPLPFLARLVTEDSCVAALHLHVQCTDFLYVQRSYSAAGLGTLFELAFKKVRHLGYPQRGAIYRTHAHHRAPARAEPFEHTWPTVQHARELCVMRHSYHLTIQRVWLEFASGHNLPATNLPTPRPEQHLVLLALQKLARTHIVLRAGVLHPLAQPITCTWHALRAARADLHLPHRGDVVRVTGLAPALAAKQHAGEADDIPALHDALVPRAPPDDVLDVGVHPHGHRREGVGGRRVRAPCESPCGAIACRGQWREERWREWRLGEAACPAAQNKDGHRCAVGFCPTEPQWQGSGGRKRAGEEGGREASPRIPEKAPCTAAHAPILICPRSKSPAYDTAAVTSSQSRT